MPPLHIGAGWVSELRASLPELAPARRARFQQQYGLSEYDANLLTATRATADYYEAVIVAVTARRGADAGAAADTDTDTAKEAANWILGDLSRLLNRHHCDIADAPVSAGRFGRTAGANRRRRPVHLPGQNGPGRNVRHRRPGGGRRRPARPGANQ